jgi:hypothetical protein
MPEQFSLSGLDVVPKPTALFLRFTRTRALRRASRGLPSVYAANMD